MDSASISLRLPDRRLERHTPHQHHGSACGTSLYLGTAALTGEDGELTPVQWGGDEEKVKRYQSELVDKNLVEERFLKSLEGSQLPDEANLAPMRVILPMMFTAFVWHVH
jgi:hypothetical protein